MAEELVGEISLAPTQQLEEQADKVISDRLNGSDCGNSLTTQQGDIVCVDCISSGILSFGIFLRNLKNL